MCFDLVSNWVENKLQELLGKEDEILTSFVMNMLQRDGQEGTDKLEKLDGKMLQVQLTGFLHKEAPVFTALLWKYMLDITTPRPPVVTYQRQAQPLPLYPLFPLQPPVVIYHNVKSEPGDRDRHRDRDRDREYNREQGDRDRYRDRDRDREYNRERERERDRDRYRRDDHYRDHDSDYRRRRSRSRSRSRSRDRGGRHRSHDGRRRDRGNYRSGGREDRGSGEDRKPSTPKKEGD
jgi:hypothetical protein